MNNAFKGLNNHGLPSVINQPIFCMNAQDAFLADQILSDKKLSRLA